MLIASPANPTGTMLSLDALKSLQDALPPHVLFVVDGAYSEYLGPDYEAALRDLVDRRDTTVMMRTFSKIYGLAALRLGFDGLVPSSGNLYPERWHRLFQAAATGDWAAAEPLQQKLDTLGAIFQRHRTLGQSLAASFQVVAPQLGLFQFLLEDVVEFRRSPGVQRSDQAHVLCIPGGGMWVREELFL